VRVRVANASKFVLPGLLLPAGVVVPFSLAAASELFLSTAEEEDEVLVKILGRTI
jgi:hypothetical protein